MVYAVIKTGGKQYRVSPGDLLIVEKLEGEPGAAVSFGEVLLLGNGDSVTVGSPLIDGAAVAATLIETRKGEKVKIFKKIRRQGYRRTKGHRQIESVLRVTGISGAGTDAKWDGEVKLTTKAELNARSRNLPFSAAALTTTAPVAAEAAPAPKAKKAKTAEQVVADADVQAAAASAEVNAPVEAAEAPAPKKRAPAKKKTETEGGAE
jgi:large subunit ribosomal protein L21